jgi:hypothetical protein
MEEKSIFNDKALDIRPPISFAPHRWGQIRRFILFHNQTYRFTPDEDSALSGADGHFARYMILRGLCIRLVPELVKDYEELLQYGYSSAVNAQELAAIVDSLFCELYSSVDCTRTVIAAVYKKHNYVPSGSTSKMFRYANENKMDERVSIEIRKALADGYDDWFQKLKTIRDAINHSSVGECSDLEGRHKGELEPKISYYHCNLAKEGNVLVTDDVLKLISDFEVKVNLFLGTVYRALNQTLEDKETTQACGVFNGRFYLRLVSPFKAVDFHSGKCYSRIYFEKEEMPTCPYVDICGAYINSGSELVTDNPSLQLESTR